MGAGECRAGELTVLTAGDWIMRISYVCTLQWRIQRGIAGVAAPLFKKKIAVTSMVIVIDLVVTSC